MSFLSSLSGIAALLAVVFSFVSLFMNRRWKQKDEAMAASKTADEEILNKLGQMEERFTTIKNMVDEIRQKLEQHKADDDVTHAKGVRARILRFNDDVLAGAQFSEEHWNQSLEDCDEYETFCEHTPDFKNGRAKAAIKSIRDTYVEVKKTGSFLVKK